MYRIGAEILGGTWAHRGRGLNAELHWAEDGGLQDSDRKHPVHFLIKVSPQNSD